MNCFLQPMYSFRIGGGALKDYSVAYKWIKIIKSQNNKLLARIFNQLKLINFVLVGTWKTI